MQRKDWLLSFIGVPISKCQTIDRMQIMKGLFLMRMESKKARQLKEIEPFYKFRPYLYGPCSFEVYSDLDILVFEDLLQTDRRPDNPWMLYSLTASGKKKVCQLVKTINKHLLKRLETIKKEVATQSIWDILKRVYKEYPEYTTQSVIKPIR